MIFEIRKGKASKINTKYFKNELELHELIDRNLEELFEIRYIKDEHVTEKHGRIETLGLDSSNRPVVIEYKRTMEKGQLSQADRYAMWIQQHKADFELLARKNLKIDGEIDFFSNPRIICFAQEYNIDDKCLAIPLGAELWKYQYYENDTLVIVREEEPEQLIKPRAKVFNTPKSNNSPKAKGEIKKTKTVEEHLNDASDELKSFFQELDNRISNLSSEINCYATGAAIIYKTSVRFLEIEVQKNRLRFHLRTKNNEIYDPKHLTEKVPETHGWGNLTHKLYLDPGDLNKKFTFDDIMDIIFQSFKSTQ